MKTFQIANIEAAAERLKNLGPAPKVAKHMTTTEAISKLKSQLQAAQKRGWMLEQLVEVLEGQGVNMSAHTFSGTCGRIRSRWRSRQKADARLSRGRYSWVPACRTWHRIRT